MRDVTSLKKDQDDGAPEYRSHCEPRSEDPHIGVSDERGSEDAQHAEGPGSIVERDLEDMSKRNKVHAHDQCDSDRNPKLEMLVREHHRAEEDEQAFEAEDDPEPHARALPLSLGNRVVD